VEEYKLRETAGIASLDRVSVHLGGRLIQESMSFSVAEGEFLAVLGPNGAGKTTLLRLLLGLIQPSSGSVSVFGRPPRRGNRQIGYVPQFRALDAGIMIRARDMVRLGLDGHRWGPGLPNRKREAAVDKVMDEVGALDLAEASLGELSGGERQRVLVAQALLSNPRLLLLDEPFASLDLAREAELVGLVTRLCRTRKVAILLVTHDVNPMLSEIDGVLFMANGRCAKGPSSEVITGAALSELYGSRVEVVEALGKLFVVGAPI
jgi:zinc/manganese transport system ATP-binding protein